MIDGLGSMAAALNKASRRTPLRAFAMVILVCLGATGLGMYSLPNISQLDVLADRANPYFVFESAVFLYLWVPFVSVAACLALLAPGLLISLGLSRGAESFGGWILKGFALSTVTVSLMVSGLQAVLGVPIIGASFFAGLVVMIGLCFSFVVHRNRQVPVSWKFLDGRSPDILLSLAIPALTLILLSPKFYWEDFNGDGAHLFVSTLQYVQSGNLFWGSGIDPELSSFPTLNAVLQFFASSWFMRLFGETAFAVRMVYLFGVLVLASTLMEMVRFRVQTKSPWRLLIGLGAVLLLYGYMLAFNTSYDPYFADIALPMGREPFIAITFLGFVLFGLQQRYAWMTVFAALAYASGPNGLILMGLWTGSIFLVTSRFWPVNADMFKTWPIKESLIALGLIALVVIAYAALQAGLVGAGLASFGSEFGGAAILKRLRYVSIDSWMRFGYWILPCGILPAVALVLWSWQDRISRALTLTTLFYFGFFYVQGYRILPHHFAPIMVLPVIVMWRISASVTRLQSNVLPVVVVAGCALAAVLVSPSTFQVHRVGSQFAGSILIADVRLSPVDADAYIAFDELFDQIFPHEYTEEAWQNGYIGASIAWYVHALQPKADDQAINYVVRRPGAAIRNDETVAAEWEGWTVTVLSADQYKADRFRAGIPSSISDILYVPRDEVFGRGERWGNRRVFDLLSRGDDLDADAENNANEGQ